MDVGVRELKSHLSAYLERVRAGETVVVTTRGKALARLVPVAEPKLPLRLRKMIEAGEVAYRGPFRYRPRSIHMRTGEKTSTDYVREQRR